MSNEASKMSLTDGLTAVVSRSIKSGREAEFEESMRSFVQFAMTFPGHRGISILRPAEGGRDYIVVDKFADVGARNNFTSSPQYRQWMNKLGEFTDGDPRIEELSGLEGWFTRSEDTRLGKPPKYKMALATFLGVFPVAMVLSLTLGPAIRPWPFVLSSAVFNACVVILLTWVVMPLVTQLLHPWLFPK